MTPLPWVTRPEVRPSPLHSRTLLSGHGGVLYTTRLVHVTGVPLRTPYSRGRNVSVARTPPLDSTLESIVGKWWDHSQWDCPG